MSKMDEARYRERERSWRDKAANLPPGADRDHFTALADGYARIIRLLQRLNADDRLRSVLDSMRGDRQLNDEKGGLSAASLE
jgi:hypothetical protein